MNWRKTIVLIFITVLILPAPILIAPQPVHAGGWPVFDALNFIKNTITSIADVANQINTYALYIKTWVLDPLAFVMSGNLLKSITAGVINFVNGQGNGSGHSQYVQNLRAHLLNTGDAQAISFFTEFGRSNNSPFGPAILSSLRANYLQGTSAAGYWAGNQCTLSQYSANPLGFVGGNFGQGGWGAWFALTTQPQNNPYAQYYRAQAELSARVEAATRNTLQDLTQGQGFLSWCDDATADDATAAQTANENGGQIGGLCADGQAWDVKHQGCAPADVASVDNENAGIIGGEAALGTNCTKKDGTPGTTKTPGSVIHDSLNKALGINLDKVAGMGSIGPQVNSLFQSLGSTLSVIAYGASILGGGGSGGLFGSSQSSGGGAISAVQRAASLQGYAGVTNTTVNQGQQAYAAQAQSAYSNTEAAANQNLTTYPGATTPTNPPITVNVTVTGSGSTASSGTTGTTAAVAGSYTLSQIDQGLTDFSNTMTTAAAAWSPLKTSADAVAAEFQHVVATCSFWAPSAQSMLTNNVAPIQTQASTMVSTIVDIQSTINTVRSQFTASILSPILIPIVQQGYANLVTKVGSTNFSLSPSYGAQLSAYKSFADAWSNCPA